jgi:hypothetical protein
LRDDDQVQFRPSKPPLVLVMTRQWASRLRNAVLEYGGPRVVVIAVPWYLTPPKIADALTREELAEPIRTRNVFGFRRRRRSSKAQP